MLSVAKNTIRLLPSRKLIEKLQVSKSLYHSWRNAASPYFDPTFPKPIQLPNGRSVFFIETEVDEWIASCIAKRDAATAAPKNKNHEKILNERLRSHKDNRAKSAGGSKND